MRGEDSAMASSTWPLNGSPPHAWGRPVAVGAADAIATVHPHMRGEDIDIAFPLGLTNGSPPHAWGRRV